ncbi:hypothetical protein NL108_006206 [Boleophthalmus pectinirostris]|nr:hypothetical protein NL108_006206 [Boleophthalmus pectinirostris]
MKAEFKNPNEHLLLLSRATAGVPVEKLRGVTRPLLEEACSLFQVDGLIWRQTMRSVMVPRGLHMMLTSHLSAPVNHRPIGFSVYRSASAFVISNSRMTDRNSQKKKKKKKKKAKKRKTMFWI